MDNDNSVIGELRKVALEEGYKHGTEAFEHRVRQLQVAKCREMRSVSLCNSCDFFDYCDLIKQVMRTQRSRGT